ncbi:MAG TPA: DUF1643 domain-containing protein [Candidatus Handelsmanbacteria bacterium]|nr:DUF1643 domain-containing protein [Candidatus Handelsmanbacteria bacterium]
MSETAPLLYDIYLTAANNTLRYALGRGSNRPLLIIGLNPSTANQYTRDQTLTRVEHFSRRRANGLIMCNLYPLRHRPRRPAEESRSQPDPSKYRPHLKLGTEN